MSSKAAAEAAIEKAFAESDVPEVHIIQLGNCESSPIIPEDPLS